MLIDATSRIIPTYDFVGFFVFGRRERIHEKFEVLGEEILEAFYAEQGLLATLTTNIETGTVSVGVGIRGSRFEAASTCRALIKECRPAGVEVGLKYLHWYLWEYPQQELYPGYTGEVIPLKPREQL